MSRDKLLALAVLLGMSAGGVGCNTVEGVGKDVEGAGEAVQEGAGEVKDEIDEET